MKLEDPSSRKLDDASMRAATGRALKDWFAHLDGLGGLEIGRRGLTQAIYDGKKLDEYWAVTIVVEYEKARGQKERDGKPKGYSICSTKTVGASVEQVFEAFGDAKLLSKWLGSNAKSSFEDGGAVETAEGDRWTFTRIRAGKDLRMTWTHAKIAPESPVEVLFAVKGKGKSGITLNHTRIPTREEADRIRAGWAGAFDRLKAVLEGAG